MSRKHDLMNELEQEYGVEVDPNYEEGVSALCGDTGCFDNCECWDSFEMALRSHLEERARDLNFLAGLEMRMDYLSLQEARI